MMAVALRQLLPRRVRLLAVGLLAALASASAVPDGASADHARLEESISYQYGNGGDYTFKFNRDQLSQMDEVARGLVDKKYDLHECARRLDGLAEDIRNQINAANDDVSGEDIPDDGKFNGRLLCETQVNHWYHEGTVTQDDCYALLETDRLEPLCQENGPATHGPPDVNERAELLKPFRFTLDWAQWLTNPGTPAYLLATVGTIDNEEGEKVPLVGTVQAIALALLGVIITFGTLQYFATGFVNSSGGLEAFTAAIRAGLAAMLILVWPTIVYAFTNLETSVNLWLMGGPDGGNAAGAIRDLEGILRIERPVNDFLGPSFGTLSEILQFDDLVAFLFGLAVALATLGLSVAKLMMTLGLLVLYAGMPLAFALIPVPALSWLPGPAVKAAGAMSLVPTGWALGFVVESQVGDQIWRDPNLSDGAAPPGAFIESFATPLLGVMLLLFLFTIMKQIFRWGNVVSAGGRPLTAAWGAAAGVGYMGLRAGAGAARMGAGAVRAGMQHSGRVMEQAAGLGRDVVEVGSQSQRMMDDAMAKSQNAVNRANQNQSSRNRRTLDESNKAAQRRQQALDQAHGQALGEKQRMKDRDHAEALREWSWQPQPGSDRNAEGTPSRPATRADADYRASDHRYEQRGGAGPDMNQVEDAWYRMTPDDRRAVQTAVHGADGSGPDRPPAHTFAEAVGSDHMNPNARDAYQTMFDASRHNETALEMVAFRDPAIDRQATGTGGP